MTNENNEQQESMPVEVVQQNQMLDNTDDIIASAERRIANLNKVITLALKITNQNDWVDFHGKPFLQSSGSQKVARLFGVCWRDMKTEKIISEDEIGKFYFYKTTALFYLKGKNDLVEATGTCSSKDQFFGTMKNYETGKSENKPLSEVDETNILKASITNCISNGITSLLGLKNLTWEQVKSGGIEKSNIASVKFAEGGAGGGCISIPQSNRLYAMAKGAGRSDSDIKKYLTKYYNIDSTKKVKREDYEKICASLSGNSALDTDTVEE